MVINLTLNVRYRCFRRSLICVQNIMLLLGSCTVNNLRFLRLGYTNHIVRMSIYICLFTNIFIYIYLNINAPCMYIRKVCNALSDTVLSLHICVPRFMDRSFRACDR